MQTDNKVYKRSEVHSILAHSYSVYFVLFFIGVYLDMVFNFQIFTDTRFSVVGFVLLIVASFLILWAQQTGRNLKIDLLNKDTFFKGPYKFTRSPTQLGLLFLMLGFGIMVNSSFIVLCTLVAYMISKFFFLSKQEQILTEKYGEPYIEYKKAVKL